MSKLKVENNKVIFQRQGELMMIEPYGEDCFRVRATRNGKLSDEGYTLLPPHENHACAALDESGDRAVIRNGILSAEIIKIWCDSCRITFFKNGRQLLQTREEGDPFRRYIHTEGCHYTVKAVFEANRDEHIYGLGQEQCGFFDKKGCTSELVHYNTKSAMPVIYSSLGYGFFWNNPAPGRCEFTNNHTMWVADSAYQADYLIFAGETPAETMYKYCTLTGFAPEMPQWAAGFWQSRLRYESQEELLEVAGEYYRRGIPLDVIVIDYFHWTEQGEWRFDPTLWPEPDKMCAELEKMNIRPAVSVWPTINPKSKNFAKMNEENMLVSTESGQYGIFDFYGQQTFIDPTCPETRGFVWEQIRKGYYSHGIKTFWLDEAEPEIHPQNFGNLHFHIGNGAQTALIYPYYYAKAFYEGLRSEGETEIALLTRAAYPGSQKFGAIVWNGDIPSTFEALYESIVSGMSMAMCGIPWWNSDIGGFHSGDTESGYFRELIVRWFQFGLFCPVMRLHGVRVRPKDHKPKHPDIIEQSGGDNEIWSFGEKNYPVLKDLVMLRHRLKPYILNQAEIASEKGTPIMRPMFFDFYDDEECYKLGDQYMFGNDILFAPIYRQGAVERRVYLPKGKWIRTLDKTVYEGGRYIDCHADLNEFIAFVKDGAEVLNLF